MNELNIKEALDYNLPTMFFGESGWGKSQIIRKIANEKGYELVEFMLAGCLPEDLNGIPKEVNGRLQMLMMPKLQKVIDLLNENKKVLLFFDEINQAHPQVYNTLYRMVLDKEINGENYPELRIIAAGNFEEESQYLNSLPQPLLNRFYVTKWLNNVSAVDNYLGDKYGLKVSLKSYVKSNVKTLMEFKTVQNPRNIETGLRLIKEGLTRKDKLIDYLGEALYYKMFDKKDVKTLSKDKKLIDEIEMLSKELVRSKEGKLTDDMIDVIEYVENKYNRKLTDEVKAIWL